MILKFEKAINKNQDQRVRYADQPEKFMESEADLDEEVKNLLTLTQAPHLYPELVKLGSVTSIISLLSHENTDIAIDAIDLINELTDEDVGLAEDELERSEEATNGVKTLVDALVCDHSLISMFQHTNPPPPSYSLKMRCLNSWFKTWDVLMRMKKLIDKVFSKSWVRKRDWMAVGIGKADKLYVGILENLLGLDPQLAERIALKTEFLPWLLKRIQTKGYDSNRGYASEILSILLQDSRGTLLMIMVAMVHGYWYSSMIGIRYSIEAWRIGRH